MYPVRATPGPDSGAISTGKGIHLPLVDAYQHMPKTTLGALICKAFGLGLLPLSYAQSPETHSPCINR